MAGDRAGLLEVATAENAEQFEGIDVVESFEHFTEDELGLLRRYESRVEELYSSAYVQDGRLSFTLSWKKGGALTGDLAYPGEEAVRSFLSVMRHVYLQEEPTNFHKILRLVRDHAKDDRALEAVSSYGRHVREALKRSQIALNVGTGTETVPVPPDRILDDWLNGYYWHSDDEKRQRLEAWSRWPAIHKFIFLSTLNDLYRAYEALGILVRLIVSEPALARTA